MTPFANRFTVVYDACVLYPAPLRDFLMWLALEDIFRAKWTAEIHEEWTGAVLRNRDDLTREQLERTRALMDENVRDCLIVGYEYLIPTINLPDEHDRHVLAAAIHCHANAIITFNLRDFPSETLSKYDLEALDPDDFVMSQLDLAKHSVLRAAKSHRENLRRPPKTVDQYLATMTQSGLVQTVTTLRRYRDFL